MEIFLNNFLLIGSIILLLSVLLSKSSSRFGFPILIIFMLIGILAGSEGLGGIHFENYELTHSLSLVALCLIIFSGGIETKIKNIKKNLGRGILLSSVGVLLTTIIVGFFVHKLLSMGILESFLLGAILSATDAAAVFGAFKDKKAQVTAKNKNLLKFESGSNDPMAYFLVTIILGIMESPQLDPAALGLQFLMNPLIGLIVGLFLAKLFISLNNIVHLEYVGLYPALTLSFVFLNYSLASYFQGNGFLAVYVFGLLISSKKILHKKLLYSFYDGVSWLSQIGLFVMLGLLVFPSRLFSIAAEGLIVSIFLIFIARPLTIFVCLAFSQFTWKEKTFISWAGLKGATPIVFASLAAMKIGDKAYILFDIVFFVVLISALGQGMSLKFVARKLGLLYETIEDPNFPIDFEVIEKTKNGIKELRIQLNDYALDKRVVDLNLPTGCLVLFIKREGAFLIPDGSTKFLKRDRVVVVTKSKADIELVVDCFKQGPENPIGETEFPV
ncbi:MAG: potassium/proton antiporter [Bacteriovoracaceae bacterium]|jgi:cell volume regulation protein A|nr:potassium/proton antiporter [Halobacteriovoraceae bacterium]MDP7320580.1 potassium/proton antiporter [Bacteriovoracaceae bacterium]